MPRPLPTLLALLAATSFTALPVRAQDGDGGSVGGAVVGGIAGGVGGLLGIYPLLGCPLATIGAARDGDFCDVASLSLLVGGTAAGAWIGATDSGAGYGMGVGLVAGFGAGLLLGRVVETPRWVDSLLLLTGVVVGGIVGADDDGGASPLAQGQRTVPLLTLPLARF
ncbi:MAG: hypothetical protein RQ751_13695 [Longimicrobiales bacterium]|nr:hypothetical protein [Longimicrobiales bacterium]